MTPEEMRRLPAGRELDVLIAERVMGCRVVAGGHDLRCDCAPEYPHNDPDWEGAPSLCDYSTRIADAWRVIEHLRSLGWMVELAGDATWHCTFEGHESRPPVNASADAAPLAICRAALLAVEKTP